MRIKLAVPEEHVSPDVVDAALESVTRLNQQLITAGQVPPFDMHNPQVRWKPEPWGEEHFDNAAIGLSRGWMDCDDLAPYHAASLRTTGEDPGAIARVYPSGPSTYHAIVQRSDGSIDDPSVAAGMRPINGTTVVGGPVVVGWEGGTYTGSLLPTVGPLSCTCGPSYAVRPLVIGGYTMWQARCDAPIVGSRMVHVRSYWRHRGHRGRKRSHGAIPYSYASISYGPDPHSALQHAVIGAMMLAPEEDRWRYLRFLHGAR
jgi:hypothetical protein